MEIALCKALGIEVRTMALDDVYLLGGVILRDEVLRQRCLPYLEASILPAGTREMVIKAMTPAERLALRERVTGVLTFKRTT